MTASTQHVAAAMILASLIGPEGVQAQLSGTSRQEKLRADLSIPGREVRQVVVSLEPGVTAPRHAHPGEELVYVLSGLLEYRLDGQPAVILKPGDTLLIQPGQMHEVRNVGTERASELATYLVEKGKPLLRLGE